MISDSNHVFKIIGIGSLVAEELLGNPSALPEPFRLSRLVGSLLLPVINRPTLELAGYPREGHVANRQLVTTYIVTQAGGFGIWNIIAREGFDDLPTAV